MSIALLSHLGRMVGSMPVRIDDPETIDQVRALAAAGLVVACTPAVDLGRQGHGYANVAVVSDLSQEGLALCARLAVRGEESSFMAASAVSASARDSHAAWFASGCAGGVHTMPR